MRRNLLAAAACLLAAAPSRAFWWDPSLDSHWLGRSTITVDGSVEDWKSIQGDDDQGLSFAFANDEKDLYLMVSPHTKSGREQMAGELGQDFFIWIDTDADKGQREGFKLPSPESLGGGPRLAEGVGLDTADVEVVMGPVAERGVLEARIPLRLLGPSLPKRISVGFTLSPARRQPARRSGGGEGGGPSPFSGGFGRRGGMGGRRAKARPGQEPFYPIQLWVRVKLARPH